MAYASTPKARSRTVMARIRARIALKRIYQP
jgi:hypothetical protein